MAKVWIATDSTGDTYIFTEKPTRDERIGIWAEGTTSYQQIDRWVSKSLCGRVPKWKDEPIELKITEIK